ncbi:MAG: flotillin family protein [Deltaproteobacteria bacterium]|nr:flotillin family protein [Deltaproteobacteria bacterium]
MAQFISVLFTAALIGVGFLVLMGIFKKFLYICRPNEILIFSGRDRRLADGSTVGFRVVFGGRAFRWPILEKVDGMDLTTISIDFKTMNAYSKGGIPLDVQVIANVKVSNDPMVVGNAIERFLGRDPSEIETVARETLEGHVRGVLAKLTPEEVNEDRLKFATHLQEEVKDDFDALGLMLDTLKIQAVHDKVDYLDSIGKNRIANILRDAEIAESNARSEAAQEQARAAQAGKVARENSDAAILTRQNELRRIRAELASKSRVEEERAEAAAQQARAEAELELQEIRSELEKLRLQADVVLPAQSQQTARAYKARGDAASIAENGKAMAWVLQQMSETWLSMGADAKEIFLIQQLETILKLVVERVNNMRVAEVNLIDGGDGQVLPSYVASYPATVAEVLRQLKESTGVDVPGMLTGTVLARGGE